MTDPHDGPNCTCRHPGRANMRDWEMGSAQYSRVRGRGMKQESTTTCTRARQPVQKWHSRRPSSRSRLAHVALQRAVEVALMLVGQLDRVQHPALPVLDVDARQVLACARDQLDAYAVLAQRIRGHVVDEILEQLVVVFVVNRRANVSHDLVWRQVAICYVGVHRIVEQHLHIHVGYCCEPLHKLEERFVVHDERNRVVD
mmetsp:Transcript_32386/g.75498  ORF Transcript_32386/g.75498 Transcript_32386/m.75498 type:complete len:200 (+) Transcript_32386:504-1103(+)